MGKKNRDYEPLVPSRKRRAEDDGLAAIHVSKKALKVKGSEVVFNPVQHKEFITGFRKRKQQRRKEAEKNIKKKEREQKLAERAEKRAKLKEQLGLGDKWGASSDEDDEASKPAASQVQPGADAKPASVSVYEQQGMRTVVTTAPLSLHSESEPSGEESEGVSDDGEAQHHILNRSNKPTSLKGNGLQRRKPGHEQGKHVIRNKKGRQRG